MRFAYYALIAAMLTHVPAQAADWPDPQRDSRFGAFVGVRLQLRAGGTEGGRARASFAIAPTRSTYLGNGEIRTRIGEGLALEFSPSHAPHATLAGMPVAQSLGMTRGEGGPESDRKLGVSTGAWVGLGLGAAALAGAVIFLSQVNDCDDHDDECP